MLFCSFDTTLSRKFSHLFWSSLRNSTAAAGKSLLKNAKFNKSSVFKESSMTNKTPEDAYCSTTEAARLLGLSVGTVQTMVEDGRLTAWKTGGGHRRIAMASVQQLLQAQQGNARLPASDALSVYVVEDDSTLLVTYEKMLQRFGVPMHIKLFDNGLDALLQLGQQAPHLLILDLEIPFLDGFEMLKRIRGFAGEKPAHILVVSGLAGSELSQHPVLSGVAVQPKPLPPEFLHGYIVALQQAYLPQHA